MQNKEIVFRSNGNQFGLYVDGNEIRCERVKITAENGSVYLELGADINLFGIKSKEERQREVEKAISRGVLSALNGLHRQSQGTNLGEEHHL